MMTGLRTAIIDPAFDAIRPQLGRTIASHGMSAPWYV